MEAFEFRLEDKRFVVELYLHWVTFEGKGITLVVGIYNFCCRFPPQQLEMGMFEWLNCWK